MVTNPAINYLSPEDYLEGELRSPVKHEYRDGQVYVIAGASDPHVTITINLVALLKGHLRGKGCRLYAVDTKAHIQTMNLYYYPDVMVTCDPRDRAFNYFKRHPKLIVEVLSPTTESFDRGDKFDDYQTLESLEEYVLMSQDRMRVEVFRRNAEGLWVRYVYREGQEVYLSSVEFRCDIVDLYEDVVFSPESPNFDSDNAIATDLS